MGNAVGCYIVCRTVNKLTGKLTKVKSLLHEGILRLGKFCDSFSRKDANGVYLITLTDAYRNKYGDSMMVDINGEPFIDEVWDRLNSDPDIKSPMNKVTLGLLRDCLNDVYKSGPLKDFLSALDRANEFNRTTRGSDLFMGTVRYDASNRLFVFEVVDNSMENLDALVDLIYQNLLYTRLQQRLKTLGISVGELTLKEKDQELLGIYDTTDAAEFNKRVSELIRLADPTFDPSTLSDEVGHLIIGLSGDHPLFKTLLNALSTEAGLKMAKEVLGDSAIDKIERGDTTKMRELMGHLVAHYLREEYKLLSEKESYRIHNGPFKSLFNRIWNFVKNGIKKYTPFSQKADKDSATFAAQELAKKFFDGSLNRKKENIITKEKLHSNSDVKDAAEKLVDYFKLFAEQLDAISPIFLERVDNLKELLGSKDEDISLGDNRKVATALDELLVQIREEIAAAKGDIANFVSGLDIGDTIPKEKWGAGAMLVRRAWALKGLVEEARTLLSTLGFSRGFTPGLVSAFERSLKRIDDVISDRSDDKVKDNFYSVVNRILNAVVKSWLLDLHGTDSFYLAGQLFIDNGVMEFFSSLLPKNWNLRKKLNSLEEAKERLVSIESYVENALNLEPHLIERWLLAASSNDNLILQLMSLAEREATHWADSKANELIKRVMNLRAEWENMGILKGNVVTGRKFLEKGPDGLTGNYVTELDWGAFHRDIDKLKEEYTKLFILDKVEDSKVYPNKEAALESHAYKEGWRERLGKWYLEKDSEGNTRAQKEQVYNSKGEVVKDATGQPKVRWVPNPKVYTSKLWKSLSGEKKAKLDRDGRPVYDKHGHLIYEYTGEKKILMELIELQKEICEFLPEDVMPYYRVPLFKGKVIARMMNAFSSNGNVLDKAGTWFRNTRREFGFAGKKSRIEIVRNLFNASLEGEHDKGLQLNFSLLNTARAKNYNIALNRIRKISLLGVDRLNDMGELNDDPFGALIALGHMAYSYKATLEVANFSELTLLSTMASPVAGLGHGLNNSAESSTKKKTVNDMREWMDLHLYKLLHFQMEDSWANSTKKRVSILANSVTKAYASLTSLVLLAGNTISMKINFTTASIEVLANAFSTKYYNVGNLMKVLAGLGFDLGRSILQSSRWSSSVRATANKDRLLMLDWGINSDGRFNGFDFNGRILTLLTALNPATDFMRGYSVTDWLIRYVNMKAFQDNLRMYHVHMVDITDDEGNIINTIPVRYGGTRYRKCFEVEDFLDTHNIPEEFKDWYRKSGTQAKKDKRKNGLEWVCHIPNGLDGKYFITRDEDGNPILKHINGKDYYEVKRDLADADPILLPEVLYSSKVGSQLHLKLDVDRNGNTLDWYVYDALVAEGNRMKNDVKITFDEQEYSGPLKVKINGVDYLISKYRINTINGDLYVGIDLDAEGNIGSWVKVANDTPSFVDPDTNETTYGYSNLEILSMGIDSLPIKAKSEKISTADLDNMTYHLSPTDQGYHDESGMVRYDEHLKTKMIERCLHATSFTLGLYLTPEQGKVMNHFYSAIVFNLKKWYLSILDDAFASGKLRLTDRDSEMGYVRASVALILKGLTLLTRSITSPVGFVGHNIYNFGSTFLPYSKRNDPNFGNRVLEAWEDTFKFAVGCMALFVPVNTFKGDYSIHEYFADKGLLPKRMTSRWRYQRVLNQYTNDLSYRWVAGLRKQGFTDGSIAKIRKAIFAAVIAKAFMGLMGAFYPGDVPPDEDELQEAYQDLLESKPVLEEEAKMPLNVWLYGGLWSYTYIDSEGKEQTRTMEFPGTVSKDKNGLNSQRSINTRTQLYYNEFKDWDENNDCRNYRDLMKRSMQEWQESESKILSAFKELEKYKENSKLENRLNDLRLIRFWDPNTIGKSAEDKSMKSGFTNNFFSSPLAFISELSPANLFDLQLDIDLFVLDNMSIWKAIGNAADFASSKGIENKYLDYILGVKYYFSSERVRDWTEEEANRYDPNGSTFKSLKNFVLNKHDGERSLWIAQKDLQDFKRQDFEILLRQREALGKDRLKKDPYPEGYMKVAVKTESGYTTRLIALPSTGVLNEYNKYTETAGSDMGRDYLFAYRGFLELMAKPNIFTLAMGGSLTLLDLFSIATITPNTGGIMSIYNIIALHKLALSNQFEMEDGDVKIYTNKDGFSYPVVTKNFADAFYTSGNYKGLPKYFVSLLKKHPLLRGELGQMFGYESAKGMAFARNKIIEVFRGGLNLENADDDALYDLILQTHSYDFDSYLNAKGVTNYGDLDETRQSELRDEYYGDWLFNTSTDVLSRYLSRHYSNSDEVLEEIMSMDNSKKKSDITAQILKGEEPEGLVHKPKKLREWNFMDPVRFFKTAFKDMGLENILSSREKD